MSFNDEQKAFIREVVHLSMLEFIKIHIQICPWGKKLSKMLWVGMGIGMGLTLIGIKAMPDLINSFIGLIHH
jgi:hypothetical protein